MAMTTKSKADALYASEGYRVTEEGARVNIAWPLDPVILARCLAGERIPEDERGELCRPAAGEIVHPPRSSVPGPLARGRITPAKEG